MIPKIIHYTWFSNDPFPQMVKDCMSTWKEFLPDYEFVLWDMEKISSINNRFMKEALGKRKWAFAADFVRIYALYHFGGIYIDTDVEVYKSFDSLLDNDAFIGRENSFHLDRRRAVRYLTSHCMGAVKGHPFFKACLEYYNDRPFVLSHEDWLPPVLKFDQTILPFIQMEIAKLQGYEPSDKVKGIQRLTNGLSVYPYQYFDCFEKKAESYCRHLALGGWRDNNGSKIGSMRDSLKRKVFILGHKMLGALNLSAFQKL